MKLRSMVSRFCTLALACTLLLLGSGTPAQAEPLGGGEIEPIIGESAVLEDEDAARPAPDEYSPAQTNALGAEVPTGVSNYAVTDTLIVSAQQNYDYAREVLNEVNEERAKEGVPALSLDAELTEAAMQRAAELSLLFEHTRPDGSSCFSISDRASGENIAAGTSTPSGAMNLWMNSSGHRSNILKSRWKSMGVGCVRVGSITYWVQLFSDDGASGSIPSGAQTRKATLIVVNSRVPFADGNSGFNLNMRQENPEPLRVGDEYELVVGVVNPGWSGRYCPTDSSGFTWASSNSAVVTVGSDGVAHAIDAGTATVSATSRAGYVWTKTFEVTAASSGSGDNTGGNTGNTGGNTGNTGANSHGHCTTLR